MRSAVVWPFLIAIAVLAVGCGAGAPGSSRVDEQVSTPAPSAPFPHSPRPGLLDPKGSFVLYVSNQSFEIDPVDIVIEIDGQKVIADDFEVGNQHNWQRYTLRLSPGRHTLIARSARGQACIERSFVVTGKHWAVVNYWYYSEAHGSPPEPRHFDFRVQDEPLLFA